MIIFNNNDFKYKNWSKALADEGYETITNKKVYPYILVLLFQYIVKGKTIDAYVFRYLNDRKSFFKTLINVLTDIFIISICKLKKIKIIWIAHNVDKETKVYHKFLNSFRRKIIVYFSNQILVTDPILIDYVEEHGFNKKKVDWLCFGKPNKLEIDLKNKNLLKILINYKIRLKKEFNRDKLILGFCASSAEIKCYHFLNLNDFIINLNKYSDKLFCFVLIGKFPVGNKFDLEKIKINQNKYIMHIDENFQVNEDYIKSEIDFIYRSVNDLSVSYSLYVSASIGKPIISDDIGLLPHMLEEYKLGFTIPKNEFDFKCFSKNIQTWDSLYADLFLKKRSWKVAANKIIQNCN